MSALEPILLPTIDTLMWYIHLPRSHCDIDLSFGVLHFLMSVGHATGEMRPSGWPKGGSRTLNLPQQCAAGGTMLVFNLVHFEIFAVGFCLLSLPNTEARSLFSRQDFFLVKKCGLGLVALCHQPPSVTP